MLDSRFAVFLVIKNFNQYTSISRKQLFTLISIWQIPSGTKQSHFTRANACDISQPAIPGNTSNIH